MTLPVEKTGICVTESIPLGSVTKLFRTLGFAGMIGAYPKKMFFKNSNNYNYIFRKHSGHDGKYYSVRSSFRIELNELCSPIIH